MSLFNLYNEIEKEYENLIPLKQEGLVLFHLYQKQKDGDIGKEFSEEEIIKSLREIRYDLKTNQKIQFNNIVERAPESADTFLLEDDTSSIFPANGNVAKQE